MRIALTNLLGVAFLICPGMLFAQVKAAGPVIGEFGSVWDVPDPDYKTDTDAIFKAVFDVMTSPESHETVNPAIETVARYLNMHAQSGVPQANIRAILVIHNKASKDIMTHDAYRERYGFENPNLELVEDLMNAGVEIVFCGQSSRSRQISKNQIIPDIQISLSAMTALIQSQDKGYRLIKF